MATEWDKKCKICLIKRNKVAKQVMGDIPSFRTEIQPPWSSVNMDLFGPYFIRGPRIFKKVWGVVFGTESILHVLRRFVAVKGSVRIIISDPGSQLRGANKELISWRKGRDQAS